MNQISENQLAQEMSVAIGAVRGAAAICQSVQADLVTAATLEKKDKSPVTVADFASQAVVCQALRAAFADDPIVGEEDAAELREPSAEATRSQVVERVVAACPGSSEQDVLDYIDLGATGGGGSTGRFWTLDPIDGTKGFLRGEQYAIALGLIDSGEVVLGILGCPNLMHPDGSKGVLMLAMKGHGTRMLALANDTDASGAWDIAAPVHVDEIGDVTQAVICESVESAHTNQGASSEIATALGTTAEPFRIDSQCKYAAVARGDASVYLRLPTRPGYVEKIWDHAGGMLVCTEAGGRVTDVEGKDLNFGLGRGLGENRGVVCTNGKLHTQVLAAVSKVLA